MRVIVGLYLFLIFFFCVPSVAAQEIRHYQSRNFYYFSENEDNWYKVAMVNHWEDQNRLYFGGYIVQSAADSRVGTWISGSVPKNVINKTNPQLLSQSL